MGGKNAKKILFFDENSKSTIYERDLLTVTKQRSTFHCSTLMSLDAK